MAPVVDMGDPRAVRSTDYLARRRWLALATSSNAVDLHPSERHDDYELRTDGRPRIERVFNWTGAD
jgi:hypothetical protein